jgi:hypothetical protein
MSVGLSSIHRKPIDSICAHVDSKRVGSGDGGNNDDA